MNLQKLAFISLVGASCLFSQTTKTIPQGWSLNGVGLNESAISPNSFENVKTVWKYEDNKWYVYSSDTSTQNTILASDELEVLDSLNPGDGFWINAITESNFSSSISSKIVLDSFESTEDESLAGYTYNYSTKAGVITSDKINWSQATSLINAQEYEESSFKAIPKVFSSIDKKTALILNSQDCSEDLTIAITPYSSISTIPGISKFLEENISSLESTKQTLSSTDTNIKLDLTINNIKDNSEPILAFSADISVENSSGKRLSPKQIDKICSNVDIDLLFKNINEYNENNSYKLYTIEGYDEIEDKDISFVSSTKYVKVSTAIDNFKPFFITKKLENNSLKNSFDVSLKSSVISTSSDEKLFSSKIDSDYEAEDITLTSTSNASELQTYPNISEFDSSNMIYGFSLLSDSNYIKQYISPTHTLTTHLIYAYEQESKSWIELTTNDISGMFSHFLIIKKADTSSGTKPTFDGKEQTYITIKKGTQNYFNIQYTGSIQLMTSNSSIASVVKTTGGYNEEAQIDALELGTVNITLSDNNGAAYLFTTVTDSMTYNEASSYCSGIGKSLPTYTELVSIKDDTSKNYVWEWGHYWTSTVSSGNSYKTILMANDTQSTAPNDDSYEELVYCK